jgi:hypothetical protein
MFFVSFFLICICTLNCQSTFPCEDPFDRDIFFPLTYYIPTLLVEGLANCHSLSIFVLKSYNVFCVDAFIQMLKSTAMFRYFCAHIHRDLFAVIRNKSLLAFSGIGSINKMRLKEIFLV